VLVALGGGDVRTYPLSAGVELILGRDLDCDVVLAHHRVSRRHARLRVSGAGDALAIEDLGSRNGTRVGEPLKRNQPCPVRAGDAIGIGPFTLTAVRGGGAPPPSLAVEDTHAIAPSPELLAIARGAANVLVRGDTAEAKRSLARTLHRHSGRTGRFVEIDCAAIGPEQLESELFGDATQPGALAEAADGTLLLDEVGELPPPLQDRLLQAIESPEPGAFTARLVCATDRDLLASIESRAFRPDLYYRLAGATLMLRPPRALTPAEEERRQLLAAVQQADGNMTRAAKLLGITRAALADKLAQHQVPRPMPRRR
jgi:hypothetical protein